MNATRRSVALIALAAFSLLAACSGGGGGSLSPAVAPSNNPGGGPTTAPTTSPTSAPTGQNSNAISSPSLGSDATTTIHAEEGWVNGSTSWYSSGTTAWNANSGDTASGANGSNTVDGVSCSQMSEPTGNSQLHVHSFLGLYVNGTEEAIPSAIAIKKPAQPSPETSAVASASCFYRIHTHDYSGLIHVEDNSLPQSYTQVPSYAKLKTVFDLWGEGISNNSVAGFTGSVAIYIGKPSTQVNGADLVTSYTPFNGDLTTIALGHHVAFWIVVGTPPASGLPQVEFNIEN